MSKYRYTLTCRVDDECFDAESAEELRKEIIRLADDFATSDVDVKCEDEYCIQRNDSLDALSWQKVYEEWVVRLEKVSGMTLDELTDKLLAGYELVRTQHISPDEVVTGLNEAVTAQLPQQDEEERAGWTVK